MKILLVETSPIGANNVTVHARNAVLINDYFQKRGLDSKLVWKPDQITVGDQFDVILFFSASFYFPHEKFTELLDSQTKCKVGWLTNDYELFMNDFLKGRTDFLIGAFDEKLIKKAHTHNSYLQVKLNSLITCDTPTELPKTRDICYYGTFRKYRVPYFKKWLRGDMVLSTSKKNWDKYGQIHCDCWATTQFNWVRGEEQLARFRASLYIEDTKSHIYYCSFANRFFEALNCNVLPVFDPSCLGTLRQEYKYFVPDALVCEPDTWRANIEKVDAKEFFRKNRAAAILERDETLAAIEKFLTKL